MPDRTAPEGAERTAQGMVVYGRARSLSGRDTALVQESSHAQERCCWLYVDTPQLTLTVEGAKELRAALTLFIEDTNGQAVDEVVWSEQRDAGEMFTAEVGVRRTRAGYRAYIKPGLGGGIHSRPHADQPTARADIERLWDKFYGE